MNWFSAPHMVRLSQPIVIRWTSTSVVGALRASAGKPRPATIMVSAAISESSATAKYDIVQRESAAPINGIPFSWLVMPASASNSANQDLRLRRVGRRRDVLEPHPPDLGPLLQIGPPKSIAVAHLELIAQRLRRMIRDQLQCRFGHQVLEHPADDLMTE